ncbi:MAG TPA: hypothetical protein VFC90_03535 [Planctomycetota bacterium]|nr:hypothetical protein [Planctomycetota bacterium]
MRTRLKDLPVQAVFEGKNWVVQQVENQDPENPLVDEATDFGPSDLGLFSAIARFSDGSQHPAVVLKSFQLDGEQVDTYVYTRMGWVDLMSPGVMRALSKYSTDIFPLDVYLANPWVNDKEIAGKINEHRQVFREALPALKTLKYDPFTTKTRRRFFGGAEAAAPEPTRPPSTP